MRITVLGGCGAWPGGGQACSGYLVEHEGFRLLLDPGYATLPRLLERVGAEEIDAVLALDRPGMLDDSYRLHEFAAGAGFEAGPFRVSTWALPHFVPNAGVRLSAGGRSVAYTGDTGPSPDVVELARGADLFLAEATYPEAVPREDHAFLSSARQAGQHAERAGVGRLLLTHLWPATPPEAALTSARRTYGGPVSVATPTTTFDLSAPASGPDRPG